MGGCQEGLSCPPHWWCTLPAPDPGPTSSLCTKGILLMSSKGAPPLPFPHSAQLAPAAKQSDAPQLCSWRAAFLTACKQPCSLWSSAGDPPESCRQRALVASPAGARGRETPWAENLHHGCQSVPSDAEPERAEVGLGWQQLESRFVALLFPKALEGRLLFHR